MVKKSQADNLLQDEIYSGKSFPVPKLIMIGLSAMMLGFALNFSVGNFVAKGIERTLTQNPTCPIQYQSFEPTFLYSGVSLKNLEVSSQCFNVMGPSLKFTHATLQWRGLSFYPFGLKFRFDLEGSGNKAQAVLALGLPQSMLRVQETQIDAQLINTIVGRANLMKGQFKIEIQSSLSGLNLEDASVLISSSNFSLPPQNINGLTLPPLQLNQLAAKMRLEGGRFLTIENITLGSDGAPLIAKASGTIELDQININRSPMSLDTELKIAPELNQSFPILNLFLGNKPQRDGFYILKVGGTVGAPALL